MNYLPRADNMWMMLTTLAALDTGQPFNVGWNWVYDVHSTYTAEAR